MSFLSDPPAREITVSDVLNKARKEIAEEYAEPHNVPWIIGYSGGKDSTLVAHLVIEHLLSISPSKRTRPVHIVANDTLVESPFVIAHLKNSLAAIQDASEAFLLPVKCQITQPADDKTFWVNVIGRGYPPPNRMFRWCTDRMKIQPTISYIKGQSAITGKVILLLGVRRAESSARAQSVARYDNGGRLNPHNDLKECMVFRPIVELSTKDVWEFLALNEPPWGGSHGHLIKLYQDASGGECPVITQKSDTPSCGTSSSRFGCWTCTVVEKDKSLAGFVEAGFEEFGPLIDFREWLVEIRNDPKRRMARRRDGRITVTNSGMLVPGPFVPSTRREILDRLLKMETVVGYELISRNEIDIIERIWSQDAVFIASASQHNLAIATAPNR